jgi:hypothetical protein
MIQLSEIFKKNNFNDYLCILNKNTEDFKDVFPHYIIIDNSINEELLFDSIKDFHFMNLKIFFSNLNGFYEKEYNKQILDIIDSNKNNSLIIISPLGVFNNLNFINNTDKFTHYPSTKILSENFLKFHKFHCCLKNKNSILLSFFFHYSYNLGDLYNFFLRNNLCKINNFNYSNLILKSFSEGIRILEESIDTNTKLYKDLIDFQTINVYNTYIYWKNYFNEPSIKYCHCNYTTYKEIENFTYYHLEKETYFKDVFSGNNIKRHININLNTPETINNYKNFYLENILNFPDSNPILEKYYKINNQQLMKNIKVKSLVFNKKVHVFNWYY